MDDGQAGGCCTMMANLVSGWRLTENKTVPEERSREHCKNTATGDNAQKNYSPELDQSPAKMKNDSILTMQRETLTSVPYRPSEQRRHSTDRLISIVSQQGTRVSNRDLSRMSKQSRASMYNSECFPTTLQTEKSRTSQHSLKEVMSQHREGRKTTGLDMCVLEAIDDGIEEAEETESVEDPAIMHSSALKALENHQERRRSSYNSNAQRRASAMSEMGRASLHNYAQSNHGSMHGSTHGSNHGSRKSFDNASTDSPFKSGYGKTRDNLTLLGGGRKSASQREVAITGRINSASSDRPVSAGINDDVNYNDTNGSAT